MRCFFQDPKKATKESQKQNADSKPRVAIPENNNMKTTQFRSTQSFRVQCLFKIIPPIANGFLSRRKYGINLKMVLAKS